MLRWLALILFPLSLFGQTQTEILTDTRDGRKYSTVKIGNQVWMAENLAYEPYGGKSFAYDYKDDLVGKLGRLYTWDTAISVCPDGWHLPEGWEYSELYSIFGTMKKAGGALKNGGTKEWNTPNTGASNTSGFNVLPGGAYSGKLYLTFNSIGKQAYFWTSTEVDDKSARVLQFGYNHAAAYDLGFHPKNWALSVRCLKD